IPIPSDRWPWRHALEERQYVMKSNASQHKIVSTCSILLSFYLRLSPGSGDRGVRNCPFASSLRLSERNRTGNLQCVSLKGRAASEIMNINNHYDRIVSLVYCITSKLVNSVSHDSL